MEESLLCSSFIPMMLESLALSELGDVMVRMRVAVFIGANYVVSCDVKVSEIQYKSGTPQHVLAHGEGCPSCEAAGV